MVIWTIIAAVATYVVVDIAKSIREEKDDTYEMDVKEALEPDPIFMEIQDQIDKIELAKKEEEIRLYREELAKQKAEEERIAKEKEEKRLAKIEADTKTEQAKLAKSTKQKQSKPRDVDVASESPNRSSNRRLLGTFNASAYTDNAQSQGQYVGKTATGMKPQAGVVAVDPKVIPLGTKLYIEGYGNAVAGDVGGAIKGNKIDLFMNTQKECINFGRRNIKVWIRD